MTLSPQLVEFLNENSRRIGAPPPERNDDLFKLGIVDSFTLIDLVTLLEDHYEITIPDSDVKPENFRAIVLIEQYLDSKLPKTE